MPNWAKKFRERWEHMQEKERIRRPQMEKLVDPCEECPEKDIDSSGVCIFANYDDDVYTTCLQFRIHQTAIRVRRETADKIVTYWKEIMNECNMISIADAYPITNNYQIVTGLFASFLDYRIKKLEQYLKERDMTGGEDVTR